MLQSKSMIVELIGLPDKISKLELETQKLNVKLSDIESECNLIKMEHTYNISNAVVAGKKIYTNDESRKTELYVRLNSDSSYIELEKQIEKIKSDIYINNNQIHLLENKQRNIRSILGYLKSTKSIEELLD